MRHAAFPAVFLVACLGLQGCFLGPKKFVIPEMPTAREQYALAYDQYRHASSFFGQSEKKDEAVEEAMAAFRAVLRNFPEDTTYRPLSALMLGRCELIRDRFTSAADYYRRALKENPDSPEVQQIGLYELGVALDGAKQYVEAKEAYRTFIERYSDDAALKDDPEAQKRLTEARVRYRIIRSE